MCNMAIVGAPLYTGGQIHPPARPLPPVMYSLSSQKVLSVGRRQAPRKGTTLG